MVEELLDDPHRTCIETLFYMNFYVVKLLFVNFTIPVFNPFPILNFLRVKRWLGFLVLKA